MSATLNLGLQIDTTAAMVSAMMTMTSAMMRTSGPFRSPFETSPDSESSGVLDIGCSATADAAYLPPEFDEGYRKTGTPSRAPYTTEPLLSGPDAALDAEHRAFFGLDATADFAFLGFAFGFAAGFDPEHETAVFGLETGFLSGSGSGSGSGLSLIHI